MKLIKKIAAIMLSVMMVLGMASVVSAEGITSGAYNNTTGTITINNAIVGQTYTIYRILKLESFSGTGTTGNYAYKVENNWDNFIKYTKTSDNENYLVEDASGYVTWNTKINDDDTCKKEFAKKALAYAKDTNNHIVVGHAPIKAESNTVSFEGISLGYYVVDSSAGTLCSLTTTTPNATILEKNAVPTVEKKVQEDSKVGQADEWGDSNTADIGQTVNFQTTITAQPGAQNYVLHDKMDAGLTFAGTVTVKKNGTEVGTTNYTLKKATDSPATITDECTFEIVFTQTFCDTLAKDEKIIVTYSATLNDNVESKKEYKNDTWLSYGDNSTTTHSTTKTKTFELPVFKYTMKNNAETALADATFTLSKKDTGADPINLVNVSKNDTTGDIYRVAKENEETGTKKITEIITTKSGKFTIKGLDADTYYLTETKQPAGYNKLKDPVTVVISEDGTITVGSTPVTEVKVQNNTGTILPTTGGNGTSLIYFLGAVLALVSGVVLITKQRMKNS